METRTDSSFLYASLTKAWKLSAAVTSTSVMSVS